MEVIDGPSTKTQPDRHSIGIRLVTPFRGMFAVRDHLMEELYAWTTKRGIGFGHTFFRLNVVDMDGPMDIEVGVMTDEAVQGDDRVRGGVLPAGRYAAMTYVNHAGVRTACCVTGFRSRVSTCRLTSGSNLAPPGPVGCVSKSDYWECRRSSLCG